MVDVMKGWGLGEVLDSGCSNTVGEKFVLIIADTSVKRQLIIFDSIETVDMRPMSWQKSDCGASLSDCW